MSPLASDHWRASVVLTSDSNEPTFPAAVDDTTNDDANQKERLQQLLDERIRVLQQLVEALRLQHQTGLASVQAVYEARKKLLAAQLDHATTSQERTRFLTESLANLRALEDSVMVKYDEGQAAADRMLAVKAERLEAEILLHREQQVAAAVAPPNPPAQSPPSPTGVSTGSIGLHTYQLGVGDVLGIYIRGVLGGESWPKPTIPDDPSLPPAVGFPIPVLSEGEIHLPLVAPIEVE